MSKIYVVSFNYYSGYAEDNFDGIVGVYSNLADAVQVALVEAANESDDSYWYEVAEFTLDAKNDGHNVFEVRAGGGTPEEDDQDED